MQALGQTGLMVANPGSASFLPGPWVITFLPHLGPGPSATQTEQHIQAKPLAATFHIVSTQRCKLLLLLLVLTLQHIIRLPGT